MCVLDRKAASGLTFWASSYQILEQSYFTVMLFLLLCAKMYILELFIGRKQNKYMTEDI